MRNQKSAVLSLLKLKNLSSRNLQVSKVLCGTVQHFCTVEPQKFCPNLFGAEPEKCCIVPVKAKKTYLPGTFRSQKSCAGLYSTFALWSLKSAVPIFLVRNQKSAVLSLLKLLLKLKKTYLPGTFRSQKSCAGQYSTFALWSLKSAVPIFLVRNQKSAVLSLLKLLLKLKKTYLPGTFRSQKSCAGQYSTFALWSLKSAVPIFLVRNQKSAVLSLLKLLLKLKQPIFQEPSGLKSPVRDCTALLHSGASKMLSQSFWCGTRKVLYCPC